MVRKRAQKPVQVSRLFKGLLPENFPQKRAQIQQYQHFFESIESDAVFQMVRVNNVTHEFVSITLPNAALSSYLRLHSQQIKQLIQQYFGVDLDLKISTRPDTSQPEQEKHHKDWLPDISQSSCAQINTAAEHVEGEALKQALQSLSATLSGKKNT